ncbi:hypothetical protein DFH08DRAFT_245881 [Mycena albidolilacea]|uniref:F-box domain-containing protein n=1 Tax=Mycena albidolilacea TaxID=1033008 RepID=A0AAD6ZVC3_9AGAR|nr:hypothetical protein DFH08DRAFT_245881 [Mycena albidolilacea]
MQAMQSPFAAMLHTNAVPSDAERQRIQELLAGPQMEAAHLASEIKRLQAMVGELAEKRGHLNDFIDPHVALLSPARRLPQDVMEEIFVAALPSDRNAIMSSAESPLLLCHVCRTWRAIALSTPRLWGSLHVVVPKNISALSRINGATITWLSRSGVLPLSISLVYPLPSPPWEPQPADFSTLLQTLVRYSSRWSRVRFDYIPYSFISPLAALSPADVPILKTFVFEGDFSQMADISSVVFLGTASLHSLSIRRIGMITSLPISWNRLRHLSLADRFPFHADAALRLLRQCPNLETCSLQVVGVTADASLMSCRMEQLRQFSVAGVTGQLGSLNTDFFERLDLPNLRSLEYTTTPESPGLIFTPLLGPENLLQCLCFRLAGQLPSEGVLQVLRLVPALRELVICYDSSLGPEFWTALIPSSQNTRTLCPELRIVKFVKFKATPDSVLLEFIQARTGEFHFERDIQVTRLEKVHVQLKRSIQVDIVPALERVIGDGLDLILRYEPPAVHVPGQGNAAYTQGERLSDSWDAPDFSDDFSDY